MKKIISFILVMVMSLYLTSCYKDIKESSLEDYIACINQNKCGHSSSSIDSPKNFLPSISFLEDYEYLEGNYFWREDDPFRVLTTKNLRPEISFLRLTYDESNYTQAKECMFAEIEPYNQKFYPYNDYIFYENSNFIALKNGRREFPEWFTMACYNDEIKTLIFIGFEGTMCLKEEYLTDIEANWMSFIDTYYGDIYDFDK